MDICRSCLAESFEPIFVSLFSSSELQKRFTDLTTVQIDPNDRVSTQICQQCKHSLDTFQEYRNRCINSNQILKDVKNENDDPPFYPHDVLKIEIINTDTYSAVNGEFADPPSPETHSLCEGKAVASSPKPTSKRTKSKTPTTVKKPKTRKLKFEVNANGQYKCFLCPREFLKLEMVRKHVRMHQRKKPLICDDCGKVLSCAQSLKTHKRHMHMNLRPYTCDQCTLSFKNKATMIEHTLLRHLKERKYLCDICSSSFKSQKSMKSHIKAVHETKKTHPCTQCELAFKTRYVLATHFQNIHTQFRPYVCDLCSRGFGLLRSLQTHMQTHKDGQIKIRNSKCENCSKMFLNDKTLRKHKIKFHKSDDVSSIIGCEIKEENVYITKELSDDDESHIS